jgi:hypothetical protein
MIVKMDKDAPYGVMADMMGALQEAKARASTWRPISKDRAISSRKRQSK